MRRKTRRSERARRPFKKERRRSRVTSSLLEPVVSASQWSPMSTVKASSARTKKLIQRRSLMLASSL